MTNLLIKPWKVISRDDHENESCVVVRFFKQEVIDGQPFYKGFDMPVNIPSGEDEDTFIYEKLLEEGWDE